MRTIIKNNNSNKAIIVEYMASPWDHRVCEKEGENIAKHQDLKGKIGINNAELVVVGALD